MEIRWSPEAVGDIENIVKYIQKDNPEAARRVAESLYNRIDALTTAPYSGRPGRLEGSREIVFSSIPYIGVYRVNAKDNVIEVSRIYHGAQSFDKKH
ncbi:MAG: type II toxin-antitoxin system RelE/ParE family toxin [Bryobacteraceae bacterium]